MLATLAAKGSLRPPLDILLVSLVLLGRLLRLTLLSIARRACRGSLPLQLDVRVALNAVLVNTH